MTSLLGYAIKDKDGDWLCRTRDGDYDWGRFPSLLDYEEAMFLLSLEDTIYKVTAREVLSEEAIND